MRRAAVFVTAMVLALGTAAAPARADSFDDAEMQRLHSQLFSAYMRAHNPGLNGLKDLVLSAVLTGYRYDNPGVSRDQLITQGVLIRNALNAKLTADHAARSNYENFISALDAASGVPGVNVATPFIKEVLKHTLGADWLAQGHVADQVTGAFQSQAWLAKYFEVQNMIWGEVMRRNQADPALGEAWESLIGVNAGIRYNASYEQLKADPLISMYVDVDAILANLHDTNRYINEVREQTVAALEQINQQNDAIRAQLKAMSLKYPVGIGPKPSPEAYTAALQEAADRQAGIDAMGSAVFILSTLAGFVDPKLGKDIGTIGRAAVSAITAINQYLPTVAGLSVTDALMSASTLALTGNLLGVAMSLAPMFGLGEPDPQQIIMEQLAAIREDIHALHVDMQDRFDRVEQGLTQIYADMIKQFDRLFQEVAQVRQSLTDIQNQLFALDRKIDALAAYVTAAFQESKLDEARSAINMYLDYESTYSEPIPSLTEYTKPENRFHLTATGDSAGPTFTMHSGFDEADPLTQLDMYGTAGLVNYLARLAQLRGFDPAFPQPTSIVPHAAVWGLGASASNALQLQNPDYAGRVNPQRTEDIVAAGQRIVDASRAFSAPGQYGATNALFKGLLSNHQRSMTNLATELMNIRKNEVLKGKTWQLWVEPPIAVPSTSKPAGPIDTMPSCSGGRTVSLPNIPSAIPYSTLPHVYNFLHYALDEAKPQYSICYDTSFVNVTERFASYYYEMSASLRVTVRIYATLPGGAPIEARTLTATSSSGVVCREWYQDWYGNSFCYSPQDVMARTWSATGKSIFEQSHVVTTHGTTAASTLERDLINGKRKLYYDTVVSRLPFSPAMRQVTEAMRLLQAYTEVGWPRALQNDEQLYGLLFGERHIPADLPGSKPFADIYRYAAQVYQACKPAVAGGPCAASDPDVYDTKHPDHDWSITNCLPMYGSAYGVAAVDPLGQCLYWQANERRNLVLKQFDKLSKDLFERRYQEGNPEVEVLMAALRVTNRAVHG